MYALLAHARTPSLDELDAFLLSDGGAGPDQDSEDEELHGLDIDEEQAGPQEMDVDASMAAMEANLRALEDKVSAVWNIGCFCFSHAARHAPRPCGRGRGRGARLEPAGGLDAGADWCLGLEVGV